MRVAITGATGLIGQALTRDLLADGHEVVAITRLPNETNFASDPALSVVGWNPAEGELDPAGLEGIDVVVHLAGELIAGRWTANKKEKLKSSRAGSAKLLADTINKLARKPRAYVGASAIGYYGDRGDEELTEQSAPGQEFLAQVCVDWEAAAEGINPAASQSSSQAASQAASQAVGQVAICHARFGLVLSPQAPAAKRLMLLARLDLLGPLGGGKQWWSWITLPDATRVLRMLIDKNLTGSVNVCSPDPRRQREFAKVLASNLRRPAFMPAPRFAIKAALGEMGQALLLDSARVMPTKLNEAGFEFEHATLEQAANWLAANHKKTSHE